MAELKGVDEQALVDEAAIFDGVQDVTLGETYLLLSGVLTPHGSVQIGRARFDDERDWLFRRDLDALRIFFDFSRAHLEASVSEELVDPVGDRQKDVRNTLLLASLFPGLGNVVSAYLFDRDDRFLEPDGEARDFSPRYLGVRAYRDRERSWAYWLEAAWAEGSMEGRRLRGRALDAGVSFTARAAWEPTVTVAYAFGSGDDDPFDEVDRTFRQTGLHLNNGKWNGVTSFRYYGQVLRPELANLHIETYGLGIRPRDKTSVDLVYHRYRLDRPASRLVRSTIRDRRLNLVDLEVGDEWDLVIGFEAIPHLEIEVDLGLFLAGKAFLGEVDPAKDISVKVKFVF
jgi:alginate production protein